MSHGEPLTSLNTFDAERQAAKALKMHRRDLRSIVRPNVSPRELSWLQGMTACPHVMPTLFETNARQLYGNKVQNLKAGSGVSIIGASKSCRAGCSAGVMK